MRESKKPDPVKTKRKKDGTMHMSLRSEVGSSIYLLVIALNYEREREKEERQIRERARGFCIQMAKEGTQKKKTTVAL